MWTRVLMIGLVSFTGSAVRMKIVQDLTGHGSRSDGFLTHDVASCEIVPGGMDRQSAWRRADECKCPVGSFLYCKRAISHQSRYYDADDVVGNGCECKPDTCGAVVPDSAVRKSAWRRWSEKCKCPEYNELYCAVPGVVENGTTRYFSDASAYDKGCACKGHMWTAEEVMGTCPFGLKSVFDYLSDRWMFYYQDTINPVSKFFWGGVHSSLFSSLFAKDPRTGAMPPCCADKFAVGFYAASLHFAVRTYTTRNASSVVIPTRMGKADTYRVGNIEVPFRDIDDAEDLTADNLENCVMELLRGIPFQDWLDDPEHSNDWTSLVGNGTQFSNKKEWIMHWYEYYEQADGSPAIAPPMIDLREHFLKVDKWDDQLEKTMAFEMIGSHRVQAISEREASFPNNPKWVVKLNSYADIEVRPGFGKYGCDLYFNQDGMPVLLVTPTGQQISNGDKDWQYWKFVWRSSLVGVITLVDHLYASHFRAANVLARATREALHYDHPLRRLLTIFTFGSISVNQAAMHTLVGTDHALHRATPFEKFETLSTAVPKLLPDPMDAHKAFFNDTYWESLPDTRKKMPYYQDGRVLFKAIEKLVRTYVETILEKWCEADTLVDEEIMHFKETGALLNSEGSFDGLEHGQNSCKALTDRLVGVIWQVTGYHRHVGRVVEYVDPDLSAFSWKDGEPFGRPMQYMTVSIIASTTARAQPKLIEDYSHVFVGLKKEKEATALWKKFQEELKGVHQTVHANNANRLVKNTNADPEEVECSLAV